MEQGIERGMERGIVQGIEQGALTTAKNALAENLPPEVVAKITGLDISTVERLRTELCG